MPATTQSGDRSATFFPRRNMILFVTALITIFAGYMVLKGNSPEPASVLLVLGYCVLLPLSLIA
jgi:hypothetical protein